MNLQSRSLAPVSMRPRAGLALLVFTLALLAVPAARAQLSNSPCGDLDPKGDYIGDRTRLKVVEDFHFTPAVEQLIRGNTSSTPGGDLDYTLRAFPNHHRALVSMMLLGQREKSAKPVGAQFTIECYFIRALRLRADDVVARMLFAKYLINERRDNEAIAQLDFVAKEVKDNPFSHYNLGLLYFDAKSYENALLHAHRAMELGLPKTELRDRLHAVGKWTEPIAPGAGAASAASASALSKPDAPASGAAN